MLGLGGEGATEKWKPLVGLEGHSEAGKPDATHTPIQDCVQGGD